MDRCTSRDLISLSTFPRAAPNTFATASYVCPAFSTMLSEFAPPLGAVGGSVWSWWEHPDTSAMGNAKKNGCEKITHLIYPSEYCQLAEWIFSKARGAMDLNRAKCAAAVISCNTAVVQFTDKLSESSSIKSDERPRYEAIANGRMPTLYYNRPTLSRHHPR